MKNILLLVFVMATGCVPLRTYTPVEDQKPAVEASANDEYSHPKPLLEPVHLIRIAVAVHRPSVRLLVPSGASVSGVSSLNARTILRDGHKYYNFDVTVHDLQGAAIFRSNGLGDMEVAGTRYKGTLEVLEGPDGYVSVINEVPMEDYVMGVLAGEIPASWPLEALKAQAIAARTFAVYKQRESRRKGLSYDLESSTQYQMYLGSQVVNEKLRQAVLETKDEIMTYQDQPIMAVFHSNCGGETSNAEPVWGSDRPYLRPESCSFDKNGKHYRWQAELSVPDAVDALRKAGVKIFDVTGITVIDRDKGGRILSLVLRDGEGRKHTVKGAAFRMALGADVVRSTRFDAKLENGKITLTGTGWGHGVGLCQDGACGMAKAGYGAFDILRHYYYGIIVDRLKEN